MKFASSFLMGLIALEHFGFLVLEVFFWTSPTALRAFNLTPEFAQQSMAMAANQGLYNGFLAAGLLFSLTRKAGRLAISNFFLGCVLIAGIFGAATVKLNILFIQAAPALLALILVNVAARAETKGPSA